MQSLQQQARARGALRANGPAPRARAVPVRASKEASGPGSMARRGQEWLSTILSRFGPATDRAQNVTTLDFEKPLLQLDQRIKEVEKDLYPIGSRAGSGEARGPRY